METVKKDTPTETRNEAFLRVKFAVSPRMKMQIAADAYSGKKSVTQLARDHSVSRPTVYAWKKRLESAHAVMAVFGDRMGRGTIEAVRAQRDDLREKLKKGTRKRLETVERWSQNKRCPTCQRWLPKKR